MSNRFLRQGLLALSLAGLLFGSAFAADQLYIRNRPFQGAVVRDGSSVWIEMQSFADAVDAKVVASEGGGYQLLRAGTRPVSAPTGKVAIGDQLLDVRMVDGKAMVSLDESARSLGMRVIANKQLGTIDVSVGMAAMPVAAPAPTTVHPKQEEVGSSTWGTNYETALRDSQRTHKPMLINFTGSDWCPYCIKLHKEVFETAEFKQWASKNYILLEVDFPHDIPQDAALKERNMKLAQRFGITGYPAVLFVQSDGKVLYKSGYHQGDSTPTAWIKDADQQIGYAKNPGAPPSKQ